MARDRGRGRESAITFGPEADAARREARATLGGVVPPCQRNVKIPDRGLSVRGSASTCRCYFAKRHAESSEPWQTLLRERVFDELLNPVRGNPRVVVAEHAGPQPYKLFERPDM